MNRVEQYKQLIANMKDNDPNKAILQYQIIKEQKKLKAAKKKHIKDLAPDFSFLDSTVQLKNGDLDQKYIEDCKSCNINTLQEEVAPILDISKLDEPVATPTVTEEVKVKVKRTNKKD